MAWIAVAGTLAASGGSAYALWLGRDKWVPHVRNTRKARAQSSQRGLSERALEMHNRQAQGAPEQGNPFADPPNAT